MKRANEISLCITLLVWATLIGAVMYAHIVFFSTYLYHLPQSTSLINGTYGIHDDKFWMLIHPVCIVSLAATLILNWKLPARRKFLLITAGIYVLALVATGLYFVPELKAFAQSGHSNLPAAEWLERGKLWEKLSWTRGLAMYCGFAMLLIAFVKDRRVGMIAVS